MFTQSVFNIWEKCCAAFLSCGSVSLLPAFCVCIKTSTQSVNPLRGKNMPSFDGHLLPAFVYIIMHTESIWFRPDFRSSKEQYPVGIILFGLSSSTKNCFSICIHSQQLDLQRTLMMKYQFFAKRTKIALNTSRLSQTHKKLAFHR